MCSKQVSKVTEKAEEVILLLNIEGLQDQSKLDKHLKREGFSPISDEPFTYIGETSTHKVNTVLYIHSAVIRALHKAGFTYCKIIFQIGEYPMEAYRYDVERREFVWVEV